jgi:hypothetical protein
MVVSPRTCTPGDWNAIMIATLSSGMRSADHHAHLTHANKLGEEEKKREKAITSY